MSDLDSIAILNNKKWQKECIWISQNRDKYINRWVAIDGDHFICEGDSAKYVYNKAYELGYRLALIVYIHPFRDFNSI